MKIKLILGAVITLLIFSCSNEKQELNQKNIYNYPNILNIKNIPDSVNDSKANAFFDQGAWFGFALPPENKHEYFGSFVGPLVLTDHNWLADYFYKLLVFRNGTNINFSELNKSIEYLPGRLIQKYENESIKIEQILIFSNSNTALIKQEIINKSENDNEFYFQWKGRLDTTGQTILRVENNSIKFIKNFDSLRVVLPDEYQSHYEINKNGYSVISNAFVIPTGKSRTNYTEIEFYSSNELKFGQPNKINYKTEFEENENRWEKYLNNICRVDKRNNIIAVKSLLTLINNWRKSLGSLKYDGLFPSYSAEYFNGFWAWDSWKQAAALAHFYPGLAMDQIRAMIYEQAENGMIPDVVYSDSTNDNWRNSKPPLASWAVWEIYKINHDINFLSEMLPKLIKQHNWWYEIRDINKNDLCEFGSSDGSLIAAKWESGMDDAVRFDSSKILKAGNGKYSLDQESIDLNSFLYFDKINLYSICAELNHEVEAAKYKEEAQILKQKINSQFYDNASGWYYDKKLNSSDLIKFKGSEGFIPLFTGCASKANAEKIKNAIMDSSFFNTYVPCPTVAADEKAFMSGYWRGPVWLDQFYFAVKGLKNYGFDESADTLVEKLFNNAEGLAKPGFPIFENYNPANGSGMNAKNFSWSAAHLILLMEEK